MKQQKSILQISFKQVIDKHGKNDTTIKSIEAKDCHFRINRDVRF